MTDTINPKRNRDWLRVLGIIIPYVLIVGTFQYVGLLIVGIDITKFNTTTSAQDFVGCFFVLLGTLLTVWLFRKYVDKRSLLSLGFGVEMAGIDIGFGLIIGLVIMAISFLLLLSKHQIFYVGTNFSLKDILYSIGIYVFVAFTEELLMRGYVLNNLMNSFNKYVALTISAVLFSLMHGANPNISAFALAELFLAGILLGYAYIYTKSLWFAIALHFSWNFFQGTIFGFNVSGLEKYNLIIIHQNTNTIWNGGKFGYEGSVTSVFFQVAALFVIYFIFNNRAPGFSNSNKKA